MKIQNILNTLYLSLLNVDHCRAQNWNFKKVTSPFSRIYLIENGDGRITHNERKFELTQGKLYLIPSFTDCNYESSLFLEHYYIHFAPVICGGVNVFDLVNFEYEVDATELMCESVKRIFELNPGRKLTELDPKRYSRSNLLPQDEVLDSQKQIAGFLETQGLLFQIFSRFVKTSVEPVIQSNINQNKIVKLALEYIHENLSKPITLSELAGIGNLSCDYFSRLFLKTMGTRPIDYVNRKRIESAQLQLITTDEPIEKAAIDNGIENFPYFNRMFKKYTFTTPGEYRRLHRLV